MLLAMTKVGIVVGIGLAFLLGLTGTVYLSLRSPEVKVPDVVGQTRWDGESVLERVGLNTRVRATRYKADVKADTILDQSPRADEVVKVGQTVAIVVSRAEAREGESTASEAAVEASPEKPEEATENRNAGESSASRNENRNKEGRNRNTSKNANNRNSNSRAAGDRNANSNANRNANRRSGAGANANRNKNANTRNANANRNSNTGRQNGNNSNRRAPVSSKPPSNPGGTL